MFGIKRYSRGSVMVRKDSGIIYIDMPMNPKLLRMITRKLPKGFIKYALHRFTYTSIVLDEFFIFDFIYYIENVIVPYLERLNNRRFNVYISMFLELLNKLIDISPYNVTKQKNEVSRLDYDNINNMLKFKILEHQSPAIEYYDKVISVFNYKGALLHADPGTGKTFMSLAIAEGVHADKIIIISPLPALNKVWVYAVTEEIYKIKQPVWTSQDVKPYNGERIVIVHYEYMPKLHKLLRKLKSNNSVIILDESHNFNELKANRTLTFIKFCNAMQSNHILMLSGTPIKAISREILPTIAVIDPLCTPSVLKRCVAYYKGSNLPILNMRLKFLSIRVEKKSIDLEQPTTTNIKVSVPNIERFYLTAIMKDMKDYIEQRSLYYRKAFLSMKEHFYYCLNLYEKKINNNIAEKKEFKKYKKTLNTIIKAYKSGSLFEYSKEMSFCNQYEKNKIAKVLSKQDRDKFLDERAVIKYLRLKIQGECLGNVVSRRRIECFTEIAKNFPYEEIIKNAASKTIVFTNYVEVLQTAYDVLKKNGFTPITIYGSNSSDLESSVKKFKDIEKINPLIATYKTLSVAITLTMANTMIMLDLPFRDYTYNQALSRVWRLGQKHLVNLYHAELKNPKPDEPTIVDRGIDIIAWSQEQVEMITGVKVDVKIDSKKIARLIDDENPRMDIKIGDFFNVPMEHLKNFVDKIKGLKKW